jgi:hypothetical protein
MKERLKQIWKDPVWSNAIGNIIGNLIGFAILSLLTYLWSLSGFSTHLSTALAGAATDLTSASGWLATPVGVPRFIFWLFPVALLCNTLLVYWINNRRAQRHLDLTSVVEPSALKGSKKTNDKTAGVSPGAARKPAENGGSFPPTVGQLSKRDDELLTILYREYPRSVEISLIAGKLRTSYPVAERTCEILEKKGLLRLIPGGHSPVAASLSKHGRNYCADHTVDG